MLTESARMSVAAEARFRIQAPNAVPRIIKVVALDVPSEDVVRRLAAESWNQATFFTASTFLAKVDEEVATADLVVMVAARGGQAHAATAIGEACSARRVMTTSLVVGARSATDDALSKTLAQVRPWSLMVVIANAEEYIADMLAALRA